MMEGVCYLEWLFEAAHTVSGSLRIQGMYGINNSIVSIVLASYISMRPRRRMDMKQAIECLRRGASDSTEQPESLLQKSLKPGQTGF